MRGAAITAAAIAAIGIAGVAAGCSGSSSSELTAPDFVGFTFAEAQEIGDDRGLKVSAFGPVSCEGLSDDGGLLIDPFPSVVEGQDVPPGDPVPDGVAIALRLSCSVEYAPEQ